MPPYLTRKANTFYFRQGVPVELRAIIGSREIKKSMGRDFAKAVSACKRYAVVADNLISQARAKLDSIPYAPFSWEGIRRTKHVGLKALTPELKSQFCNLVHAALLETDQNKRIAGLGAAEFDEYGVHISDAIVALRRQLAMGNVDPMLESSRLFLVGRGYQPELNEGEWRQLAYGMTEATLSAYENIAQRQLGQVVKAPQEEVLVSQFVVQNAENASPAAKLSPISWEKLYEVWLKECERPQRTRDAYLAAMKLFIAFRPDLVPLAVTREDALLFRDQLLDLGKHPTTTGNKIGFLGTIFNAGRNSAQYAKHMPGKPCPGQSKPYHQPG